MYREYVTLVANIVPSAEFVYRTAFLPVAILSIIDRKGELLYMTVYP
jgi:hypothetical protein